jgi:outer membrane protein W
VPSVYLDLVNEDGTEIEQDLKLRIVPWTATVRFLPLGRSAPIQPYIGAGVGVFQWRYSESGQFVAVDGTIFRDSFVGSGATAGPVVLGGVRFPVGSWLIGGEVKYQKAEGSLPADQEFSADKIDLGGWTYAATFGIRF